MFSFSHDLRPLNCDDDVLKLIEDVNRFELVVVYVEHTIGKPDVVDEAKLGSDDNDDCVLK